MSFFEILPADGRYINYNVGPVSLNVIRDSGLEVNPDVNIKVNDLNNGKKYFLNSSGTGDIFKISIILNEDDKIYGKYNGILPTSNDSNVSQSNDAIYVDLIKALDYWIKNMKVITVRTDSKTIEDGDYIITDNPSRKSNYLGQAIWELEFTKYYGVNTIGFKTSNVASKRAIYRYQKIKENNNLNSKLKNCNYKNMTYKKSSRCIGWLNEKLRLRGFISAKEWNTLVKYKNTKKYNIYTKYGVKRFQIKYNKLHKKKLTANGVLSKETLEILSKI